MSAHMLWVTPAARRVVGDPNMKLTIASSTLRTVPSTCHLSILHFVIESLTPFNNFLATAPQSLKKTDWAILASVVATLPHVGAVDLRIRHPDFPEDVEPALLAEMRNHLRQVFRPVLPPRVKLYVSWLGRKAPTGVDTTPWGW